MGRWLNYWRQGKRHSESKMILSSPIENDWQQTSNENLMKTSCNAMFKKKNKKKKTLRDNSQLCHFLFFLTNRTKSELTILKLTQKPYLEK